MKRIKNGILGREYGKKDNVFCIIYCKDAQPYLNYDVYKNSSKKEEQDKIYSTYPMLLAQMRHDGKIGFPGGKVESDSLVDGLLRELQEEINLHDIDLSRLEILSTYSSDKSHTTTFIYEVSFDDIISIVHSSKNSKHSFVENMGSFLLKLDNDTLKNITKHKFSGTGVKDINLLVKSKNLINKEL